MQHDFRPQSENSRNLILAIVLSVLILLGFEFYGRHFAPQPPLQKAQAPQTTQQAPGQNARQGILSAPNAVESGAVQQVAGTQVSQASGKRVGLASETYSGGIALTGGRIDKLALRQYHVTLDKEERITLFSPGNGKTQYFDAGWLSHSGTFAPDGNTEWRLKDSGQHKLTPNSPVTLVWDNGEGLIFERTFRLDATTYQIHVSERVRNNGSQAAQLSHYAQIHRVGENEEGEESTFYNFFGPQGFVNGERVEAGYDDVRERETKVKGESGWWGISSRYFLSAITPPQNAESTMRFRHRQMNGENFYSAIVQSPVISIPAGSEFVYDYQLYAGPKRMDALQTASGQLSKAVDFGWFHFIAKPLYDALMWFNGFTGNLGLAIIALTILLKILLFPLASKSYRSMAKLKKLQPEMEALRDRLGDDRQQFAMEMMGLYKKHKVNPMSGCWPMFMQIPVFFAMYKVILISFEFRHADFMLWIHDLSVKDPYYVLPILMGASMMAQMRMSPPASDPIQQQVMRIMPIVFTFLFLMFPAGLVLYWLTNNLFSIVQQWFIMRATEVK